MKKNHHVLLIGNAGPVCPKTLQQVAQTADLIVAVDGGANYALRAGITPDVIIGDLDSVSPRTRKKLVHSQWIFVDNQNNTDLQKALDYLVAHKYKQCTLAGFTKGRPDFTLGNLLTLSTYASKIDWCLLEDGWKIYPLIKSKTFVTRPGARVSLVPIKPCSGVTLNGLQFPLTNARLPLGTTRTLSNRTVKNRFSVRLKSGLLFVCLEA